jgi:predicted TIM-barrel fold metal-dependent hydrolase
MIAPTEANPDIWAQSVELATKLITLFGPEKAMLATNYPVDLAGGFNPHKLERWCLEVLSRFPEHTLDLSSRNAKKFYGVI